MNKLKKNQKTEKSDDLKEVSTKEVEKVQDTEKKEVVVSQKDVNKTKKKKENKKEKEKENSTKEENKTKNKKEKKSNEENDNNATKKKEVKKKNKKLEGGKQEGGKQEENNNNATTEVVNDESEKKKVRYFKSIHDGVVTGRFCGNKPKQAANKALSSLIKNDLKDKYKIGDSIDFSIKECTRGSKCKEYKYAGKRVKLDKPMVVNINVKDSDKMKEITYNFSNVVQKVK
jgi:hypothetical protein